MDGIVVSIGEKDLLEISVGSDDGIRWDINWMYFVTTSTWQSQVVKTSPDRAVVEIIPEFKQAQSGRVTVSQPNSVETEIETPETERDASRSRPEAEDEYLHGDVDPLVPFIALASLLFIWKQANGAVFPGGSQ